MTVSLKHKFNCAKADGDDATAVKPSNWNDEHALTATAGKVLGTTADTTTVSELPITVDASGQSVILPSGATGSRPAAPAAGMVRYNNTTNRLEYYTNSAWKNVDNMTVSGTQPSAAIAGDLWIDTINGNALKQYTGSAWVVPVADASITYAKIQNTTTQRVHGRKTAGSGVTEELTLSDILDFVGSAAQGDILYRGASSWNRLAAGTANYVLKTGGAGANPSWGSVQVLPSAQTLSGASVTFSGIPSGVRRIDIGISEMLKNYGGTFYVRLGTSSGLVITGYKSSAHTILRDSGDGGDINRDYDTAGFIVYPWTSSVYVCNGTMTLMNVSGNTWVSSHTLSAYAPADTTNNMLCGGGGTVTLGGVLDRVALVGNGGNFTSGTANITYVF